MTTATTLGESDKALRYGKRLLKINPTLPDYHFAMANQLGRMGRWQEAVAECRSALRLNPGYVAARAILVLCEAKAGHKDRAEAEMKLLRKLNPPESAALESWFNGLMNE
jgi:tetratricopeptide (TPR) repeat protein